MLKIITSVILSLVTIMAVTMFAVTVPAQQKQIDDNAAEIEKNADYIKDVEDFAYVVDGITDGLNTRLETLEDKHIYVHYCKFYTTTDYSYVFFTVIDNDSTIDYSKLEGIFIPANGIRQSDGKYFTHVTYSTGTGMMAYRSLSLSTSIGSWEKDVKTVQIL